MTHIKGSDENLASKLLQPKGVSPITNEPEWQTKSHVFFFFIIIIRNMVPKWGQDPVGVFPGCNTKTLRLLLLLLPLLWMDEIQLAPPQRPWKDDFPVKTNKEWFPSGAGFRPSTVLLPLMISGCRASFIRGGAGRCQKVVQRHL